MKMILKIIYPSKMTAQTLLQLRAQIPRVLSLKKSYYLSQNVFVPKVSIISRSTEASHRSLLDNTVFKKLLCIPSLIPVRRKSRRKQQDSDDDSDSEMDDNLDEDDFDAPPQFKVVTIHAPSLRMDAVLSNALNVSRNRLEELFFASCLLLNSTKVMKKGIKMDEGDYVDVIMEKLEDQIKVKRVKLLKINSHKTGTDKFILKVRVWKSPFLLDFTRKRNRP